MHQFSGELSSELGKIESRFVEQMIYGILASGSVALMCNPRAGLAETWHKTYQSLS